MRKGKRKRKKETIMVDVDVDVQCHEKEETNKWHPFLQWARNWNRIKLDLSISCESNFSMYLCDNAHFLKAIHVEKVTIRWSKPNQDEASSMPCNASLLLLSKHSLRIRRNATIYLMKALSDNSLCTNTYKAMQSNRWWPLIHFHSPTEWNQFAHCTNQCKHLWNIICIRERGSSTSFL